MTARRYYTPQEPARCAECGAPLPEVRHWRTQFCGRPCRNAHFNGLTAAARREARAANACVMCGGSLEHARVDAKVCGPACKNALRRLRRAQKNASGTQVRDAPGHDRHDVRHGRRRRAR